MNYYELFEVDKNASQAEIKKAYRKLAKRYHPDNHEGDPIFDSKFKEINLIYEILSDSNKRLKYDQTLNNFQNQNSNYTNRGNSYRPRDENYYETKTAYDPNYNFKYRPAKISIFSTITKSRFFGWAITILFFYLMSTINDFVCNSRNTNMNEPTINENLNNADSSLNTGEIHFNKQDSTLKKEVNQNANKNSEQEIKSNKTGDIKF